MSDKDYYKILGVSENASGNEIKSAYRKLAMRYHPDKVPEAKKKKSEEKFKEIAEAYYVLGDSKRRKEYNLHKKGAHVFEGGYGTGDFASKAGFDFEDLMRHFKDIRADRSRKSESFGKYYFFDDLMDIFEGVHSGFGGNTITFKMSDFKKEKSQSGYDTNIYANLKIPHDLAMNGGDARFNLNNGKTIILKIKPNTKSGSIKKLKGLGKACPTCGRKGDLIVTIITG